MRSSRAPRLALLALLSLTAATVQAQQALDQTPTLYRTHHIVLFKGKTSPETRRKLAVDAGAKVVRDMPFIEGILIENAVFTPKQAQALRADPDVESLEDNAYRIWIESPGPGFDTASAEGPGASAAELVRRFGEVGVIKEPASRRPPKNQPPPPAAPTNEVPWGIERVKAPEAWAKTEGAGVKVAVVDTGIDFKHPDLAPNYAGGFNALDPKAEPFDDNGHGSHVAGTIAAVRGNGGVAGVAPKARLYAVKVLDADGGGTPATIVDGIEWAAKNHIQVINMSLGGPSSASLRKAVKAAVAAGVTVVAAAGNDPKEPVAAPAKYPESICVSASTKENQLAFFSTTGPEVAFIAPGHEVWSDAPGKKLAMHSGTSMAAPHVSGLAALAISLGANTPAAVREMLQKASVPMKGLSKEQQGAGMIEADRLSK